MPTARYATSSQIKAVGREPTESGKEGYASPEFCMTVLNRAERGLA